MRSQFLTILCVLTFLSCGWGLIESGTALLDPDQVSDTPYTGRKPPEEADRTNLRNFYEDRASSDLPMPADPDEVRQLALSQFLYALLTGIGALLMFTLRRVGFYVYVAGVLVGLILPLWQFGLSGLTTSFGVFFSVIFVILYAYCLPEMK